MKKFLVLATAVTMILIVAPLAAYGQFVRMVTFDERDAVAPTGLYTGYNDTFMSAADSTTVTSGVRPRTAATSQNIEVLELPQIVIGGGWSTTITVSSVASSVTQINLWFHHQDGTLWTVNIPRRDGTVATTSGYNPGDIAPKGTWMATISSNSSDPIVGYVSPMVILDGVVETAKVSATYSHSLDGGTNIDGQASVTAILPSQGFSFPAVYSAGPGKNTVSTGVAIANPNQAEAHVSFVVRNMAGQTVATPTLTIAPFGQVAMFLPELASSLLSGWSGGSVDVSSDQNVAGVSLLLTINLNGQVVLSSGSKF